MGLIFLPFLYGQEEKIEWKKLSKSNAKKRVIAWVNGSEKEKAKAREILCVTREEDRFRIFEAFQNGVFKADKKHQKLPRKQDLKMAFEGGEMKEGEFVVQLPKKYKGKKSWPLLYRFHGSGSNGSDYSKYWYDYPFSQEFIAVTPTIPTSERMGWRRHGIFDFFIKIHRYMLTNYNVDTDRVYFSGFSAGGGAAFYYSQCWPHISANFFC